MLDPALGWTEEFRDLEENCRGPERKEDLYCRALRQWATRYTALQERPLEALGVLEAVRAIYSHTDGATVMVRVIWSDEAAILVAKVIERRSGPLGWITSRRLSAVEAEELRRAARSLSWGEKKPFTRASLDRAKAQPVRCYHPHGATLGIQRIEDGVLRVAGGLYRAGGCSGPCCDPEDEVLSRFFDRLVGLVQCAKPAEEEE